jgi:hypothetical protein
MMALGRVSVVASVYILNILTNKTLSSDCFYRLSCPTEIVFSNAFIHDFERGPGRVLWYNPMSWLGVIRLTSLWQTLFALAVGAQIPVIGSLPSSTCGFKTIKPSVTMFPRVMDNREQESTRLGRWATGGPLLATTKVKTQQVVSSRGQRCGDIELSAFLADAAGPVNLVKDMLIL